MKPRTAVKLFLLRACPPATLLVLAAGAGAIVPDDPPEGAPAFKITQVFPGSPAQRAGLEAGDIIWSVAGSDTAEGTRIESGTDLQNALRQNQKVWITVIDRRTGKTIKRRVPRSGSWRIGIDGQKVTVPYESMKKAGVKAEKRRSKPAPESAGEKRES